jgi:hypothetical protein
MLVNVWAALPPSLSPPVVSSTAFFAAAARILLQAVKENMVTAARVIAKRLRLLAQLFLTKSFIISSP